MLVSAAAHLSASTLRTLDGKTYEGEIRFEQGRVLLTPARGQPQARFDIDQVLQATFRVPGRVPKPNPVQLGVGQLPGGWKPADIGLVGTPGDARYYNGLFAIKGAGSNVLGKADSLYFVSQEFNGDATLTCRVFDLQRTDPFARAGLMIRGSTDPEARNAFLSITPKLGVRYSWRTENSQETSRTNVSGETAPIWLRLTRRQNVITAYSSPDGRSWAQVDQREIPFDQHIWLGLAVCSHDKAAMLAATFDNVELRGGDEPRDEDRAAPVYAGPTARAIVFRRGTTLVNVQLTKVTDKTIELRLPDGKPMVVPLADVSRAILAPLSPQIAAKMPDHGTGVLMARGDFLEGEIQTFDGGRVKVSSVLFGISNLAAGSEAAALLFNDPQSSSSPWIVRNQDGSIYYASDLKIDRDQLVFTDESIGAVKIPSWNLLEIRTGESRSDQIANLTPTVKTDTAADVDPDAHAIPPFVAGPITTLHYSLDTVAATTAIAQQSGCSLTYTLDGKYRVFLATVGLPHGTLPTQSARCTILLDGVEAYHSPPLSSLEDPTTVSIPVANAHTLTLKVDTAPLPTMLLWTDPAVMK